MRAGQAEKAFSRAAGCFFCLRERYDCCGDVFSTRESGATAAGNALCCPARRMLSRKTPPHRCGDAFSALESAATAAGNALCRPARRTLSRKNAPRAAETLFTSEIAPRLPRTAPILCRPARRMSPCKNTPALRRRFSFRESAQTAADSAPSLPPGPANVAAQKRPRTAAGMFSCLRECCDCRGQRALPSGPANVAMKNAPAQREGVFLFTAAPDPAPRGLLWPL